MVILFKVNKLHLKARNGLLGLVQAMRLMLGKSLSDKRLYQHIMDTSDN